MKLLRLQLYFSLFILLSLTALADEGTAVKQTLLAQPPARLAQLAQRFSDQPLRVDFLKADLDGSGKFEFIVAFYSHPADPGLFLRVFKQDGTGIKLIGEQEDREAHGGLGWRIDFVDIDGDGIPELDLSGTDSGGQQVMHDYFRWTGSSLHELIDLENISLADADLEDIDGDGVMELIVPSAGGKFSIYKFSGTDFRLSTTLNHDPTGAVAGGTVHIVRAFQLAVHPETFTLKEIRAATRRDSHKSDDKGTHDLGDELGRVEVTLGNLKDLKGKTVPVEQVDTTTLVLGRNLKPLRFRINSSDTNAEDHDSGAHRATVHSVLELEFSRLDLLQLLPKLKLTAPLASGDELQLHIVGRLNDGTRFSAVPKVRINGDGERDHDERGPGGSSTER